MATTAPQSPTKTTSATAPPDPTTLELEQNALGAWGVFAQGLAAAAPSVALASVPFSLFVASGKGAAWASIVGLVIAVLLASTISLQAKRTVTSGSLGTYAGNGLGPGAAFAAGISLLIGYIGFATTGTLGGVLYVESFLESVGVHADSTWYRLGLAAIVAAVATYLPLRGASLAAKYELAFELIAVISIGVIIVASYIAYGFRLDWDQLNPSHLGDSSTFVAAVTAVGAYAGFESVASLGHETRDAHRTISRALLRVVLIIGVLYVLATYPQVLHFGSVDPDNAVLPQLADSANVGAITPVVSAAVAVAFIVFVTAVISSASRSLFTFAREGALPQAFARVHPTYRTPWVGVVFVGGLSLAFAVAATFSSAGRLVFDVYGGYVATWGFLISYLLVVIATPVWLYRIKALTPLRALVSGLALVSLGWVIISNVVPQPEWPFNILPFVFLGILAVALGWYGYLRAVKPDVARRIGSIQTLSVDEQERLAELGLAEAR